MSSQKQIEQSRKKKEQMAKNYASLAKKIKKHPTYRDLLEAYRYTKDMIKHHFTSKQKLREVAKETYPQYFAGVIDEELYNPKAFRQMSKELQKYKRFFITTAVAGAPLHDKFYKSIKNYCKLNDAALLVLPANSQLEDLDPKLINEHIVFDELAINDNLHISTIKLNPKQIDPVTGLGRFTQKDGSFIFASPKQRLKLVPTGNQTLPSALMTTGAITKADYHGKKYQSHRTDYIANYDHVVGGIIVEVRDRKIYHYRQVQAEKSGSFIDLGVYYQGDMVSTVAPEALVMGDYHSQDKDEAIEKLHIDMMKKLTPKRLIMHDAFDGKSISHHDQHSKILLTKHAEDNKLHLESELKLFTSDLSRLSRYVDKMVMVKSNHDEFLDRYLQDVRFVKEPQNMKVALKLASVMVDGKDPLQVAAESYGLKNKEKFVWLQRDEDYFVKGIQLGSHGDKGSNGSRGSLRAMENAYGNSISGHTHTPEILRGAWCVGTASKMDLGYNIGPSSWFHTSGLVYPNGSRQLINFVDNTWRLPTSAKLVRALRESAKTSQGIRNSDKSSSQKKKVATKKTSTKKVARKTTTTSKKKTSKKAASRK